MMGIVNITAELIIENFVTIVDLIFIIMLLDVIHFYATAPFIHLENNLLQYI